LEVSDEFHRRLVHRIQSHESVLQRGIFSSIFEWLIFPRWKTAFALAVVALLAVILAQVRPKIEIVESSSSVDKPKTVKVATADSGPSFLSYRLAANKSLEALDDLLARDASKSPGSRVVITAATREQAGLTD